MSEKKISFWHPASLICTCFGIGKILFAPGTWGSLAGFPIYYVLILGYYSLLDFFEPNISLETALLGMVSIPIILFFIGVWASNIYERKSGKHDSKEIVIDEVVGQMLTIYVFFYFSLFLLDNTDHQGKNLIIFTTFITFRFFDIVKRGPVGWVDRNVKGGLGVMLDDVVAGIFAGATSALIFLVIATI